MKLNELDIQNIFNGEVLIIENKKDCYKELYSGLAMYYNRKLKREVEAIEVENDYILIIVKG